MRTQSEGGDEELVDALHHLFQWRRITNNITITTMYSLMSRQALRIIRSKQNEMIPSTSSTITKRLISSAQLTINPLLPEETKSLADGMPSKEDLKFGKTFAPHMLTMHYSEAKGGWQAPEIVPFQDLKISPAAAALHYG